MSKYFVFKRSQNWNDRPLTCLLSVSTCLTDEVHMNHHHHHYRHHSGDLHVLCTDTEMVQTANENLYATY
jgi:hypothetical protein